jgi:hypothetical protein
MHARVQKNKCSPSNAQNLLIGKNHPFDNARTKSGMRMQKHVKVYTIYTSFSNRSQALTKAISEVKSKHVDHSSVKASPQDSIAI